jgi:hypothetical protein
MNPTERIKVNFLTASPAELAAAERRKNRLEDAGYTLVGHSGNEMIYKLNPKDNGGIPGTNSRSKESGMRTAGESVKMREIPDCDICKYEEHKDGVPAAYDGKTVHGPWGYMCEKHFGSHGIGLGTGKGQRLVKEGKGMPGTLPFGPKKKKNRTHTDVMMDQLGNDENEDWSGPVEYKIPTDREASISDHLHSMGDAIQEEVRHLLPDSSEYMYPDDPMGWVDPSSSDYFGPPFLPQDGRIMPDHPESQYNGGFDISHARENYKRHNPPSNWLPRLSAQDRRYVTGAHPHLQKMLDSIATSPMSDAIADEYHHLVPTPNNLWEASDPEGWVDPASGTYFGPPFLPQDGKILQDNPTSPYGGNGGLPNTGFDFSHAQEKLDNENIPLRKQIREKAHDLREKIYPPNPLKGRESRLAALSPQDRRYVTLESSRFLADNTDTNDARELATRAMHFAERVTSTYDVSRSRAITSAFVERVAKGAQERHHYFRNDVLKPFLQGVSDGTAGVENIPAHGLKQEFEEGVVKGIHQAIPPKKTAAHYDELSGLTNRERWDDYAKTHDAPADNRGKLRKVIDRVQYNTNEGIPPWLDHGRNGGWEGGQPPTKTAAVNDLPPEVLFL